MARAAVIVGFMMPGALDPETGEFTSGIEEHKFAADITRLNNNVIANSKSTNDDLKLDMAFQIHLNKFTYSNFQWIKYVEFNGQKWKITNVQVQRPRLILQAGGVWNGEE